MPALVVVDTDSKHILQHIRDHLDRHGYNDIELKESLQIMAGLFWDLGEDGANMKCRRASV